MSLSTFPRDKMLHRWASFNQFPPSLEQKSTTLTARRRISRFRGGVPRGRAIFRARIFSRRPGVRAAFTSPLSRLFSFRSSSSSSLCATTFSCICEPRNRLSPGSVSMPRGLARAPWPGSRRAYGRVRCAQHTFVYNAIT